LLSIQRACERYNPANVKGATVQRAGLRERRANG
jgi:hypothetical protein